MIEIIVCVLMLVGSAFSVVGALGLVRFPDIYTRMHAATKVGTLGSGLIMAGTALHFADPAIVLRCILVVFFLLLTAPIGAHMIGRASLRLGITPWTQKGADEGSKPS